MILETIKQELEADEIIIWQGQSSTKKMIAYGDYMYIPFSLMWVGFVLFWEYSTIIYHYPFIFHFFGVPMVLIGLYMAFGRFIYKVYKKKRSCYVLTNKRAIEAYDIKWLKRNEKPLAEVGRMIRFVDNKDGYGCLVFDDINPAYMMKLNDGMEFIRRKLRKVTGFYDIPDAEAVYQEVQRLKDEAKK